MHSARFRAGNASAQFDAANQIQAARASLGQRLVVAGEGVVIGNGERFHPALDSQFHQFQRSECSVGFVGVTMQIDHSASFLSRSALAITETELKVIAALATMGLSSRPKNGYRTPAANGTPMTL